MNVGIHLLCIWNLVWSGMALQHMLGVFAPAPTSMATLPLVGGVPLTLATITTAIYVVSYVMMDPVAGGLGALLMLVLNQVFNQSHFINSHLFHQWTYKLVAAGAPVAGLPLWQAVLAFHVAAWIAQVPLSSFPFTALPLVDQSRMFTLSSNSSSLVTASLKGGHLHFLTPGTRSHVLVISNYKISVT